MNFPGKFEQDSSLSHFSMHADLGSFALDGHANTVTIPNGHLLFSGDYERSGLDLIVSDQDHRVVIHDYFRGEQRPTLVSPEGAPLDPKVIEALTGHNAYAQAAGTAPAAKVVGHVVKTTGSASVVRNGVTIDVNNGDTVYQNDVVQTGSGSTLGLVLIDGTTFNLTANARMMLNDLTYDGTGTSNTSLLTLVTASASNTSLFTLVQGAASFVAGQVAKTGDMKVATPAAVIGIRGTAVILDISSTDGKVSISVVNQQDGQTHDVQVFKCIPVVAGQPGVCTSGELIGTVNSNGPALTVTPAANFQVVVQESNKTTAQVAQEFSTFQQVLTTYDLGKQLAPNTPPPSDGKRGDANPQSTTKFAGSSTPPIESTSTQLITTASVQHLDANTETAIVVTGSSSVSVTPTQSLSLLQVPIIQVPPTTVAITSPTAVGNIINQSDVAAGFIISGTATAGNSAVNGQTATIAIIDGSNVAKYTYTTTVTNGAWSVNVTAEQAQALPDGSYIIKATVSDAVGNTATTVSQAITVDTVPPAVAIVTIEGGDNIINAAEAAGGIQISGTAEIGSTLAVNGSAVTVDGTGHWTTAVTPAGQGALVVTAVATDAAGNSTSTSTTLTVDTIAPPVATPVTLAAGTEDAAYTITAATLLAGVTDVDGPSLSITAVSVASGGGSIVNNGNGTWSYTPAANYNGPVSFNYTASDGSLSSSSIASLSLAAVNDAPVATPVALAAGTEDTAYTITAATLLAGVSDVDGPSLSITSVSVASGGGSIVNNGNGTWIYTPALHYSGPVSFSYSASDGSLSANSTASLTLAPPGVINGAAGPDLLVGTSQADDIRGLAGNDIIKGLAGNDQIDGGTGRDISDYSDAAESITVDMASGTVTGGASVGNDTLRSIEYVRGTDFNDTYVATGFNRTGPNNAQDIPIQLSVNNSFEGGGGDDNITGSAGAQTSYSTGNGGTQISYAHALDAVTVDLRAGTAQGTAINDVAHVGHDTFTAVNAVLGSDFNDTLYGTDNLIHVDAFYGGKGDDTIDGRNGYDFVSYYSFLDPSSVTGPISVDLAQGSVIGGLSSGTDTLRSVELIRGTQFNDTYTAVGFGAAGAPNVSDTGTFNEFEGMGGNDTITGNGNTRVDYNLALAAVTVDLAAGTGRSTVADNADVGIDTIGSGVNSVRGSSFNDTLSGSSNNEYFLGGYGDDTIDGRAGFDRAVYNTTADDAVTGGITVDLAAGTVLGDASIGNDTLKSIEGIQGTDFVDHYTATGYGLAGALNVGEFGTFNEFEGGRGDDVITGNGNTRIAFYGATAGVTVTFGLNSTTSTTSGASGDVTGADSSVGHDTFTGVNAVAGSAFNDTFTGSINPNNTTEEFAGRGGNDFIDGKGGFDRAFYNFDGSSTGIQADLAAGTVTGDAVTTGTDTLRSVESIRGTNFSDSFVATGFGSGALNVLNIGDFGTFNEFEGMGGDDQVTGNGNTRIAFYNAFSGVTVDLNLGTSTNTVPGDAAGVGNDTFTGVNRVRGSNFADTISGDANANILEGQGGNDRLDGRGGADTLTGGGGADTFIYATGGGADTITDFNRAEGDKIDVSGVSGIFTFADIQATFPGGNTVITFGGGDTLTLAGVTSVQQSDFIFAISGTSGADLLVGTSQADTIFGLDGNDIIKGLQGNDHIDGGTGRDVSDYSDATGAIVVDLASGFVSGDTSVGTDTLRSIEYIRGTNFDDAYLAIGFSPTSSNNSLDIPIISSVNNTFEGGGGNDTITGSAGTQVSYSTGLGGTQISYAHASDSVTVDLLAGIAHGTAPIDSANVGIDTFTGVNAIMGSDYNDTLLGTNGLLHVDVFYGGKGDDFIDGRAGYDFVTYTNFLDPSAITAGISVNLAVGTVTGNSSIGVDTLRSVELIRGTQFNDVYNATNFGAVGFLNTSTNNVGNFGTYNQFEGMGGDDTITGNGNTRVDYNFALAAVTVDLAAGTGHSTVADNAIVGNDTILGGVNSVRGSVYNDALSGSANNEYFLGSYGDDFIDGRGGFDRAVYSTSVDDIATGGITVNLAAGTVDGDASIGHDTLRSIEGITGSDFADTYVATNFGAAGFLDPLTNDVGNNGTFNEFEGGGGNDAVTGNGNTRIAFYNALDGVTVDLGAGTSHGTVVGDVAGVGSDTFTGVTAVAGSAFNDNITGSNNAANTAEEFAGRAGDDHIDGLGGFDRAFYNNDNAAVSGIHVDMASGAVTGDVAIGADTLRSVEAIRGTNFADSFVATAFGSGAPNVLNIGDFGTFNEFEGLGGNDTITGNGNTRIAFYNALDGVTVDLNSGVSHGTAAGDVAGVGNDTFTGVNAVRGSASADVIVGDAGSNTLDGQGGNDSIEGRGGADALFGGLGADRFVFAAVADSTIASHDTISDFVHGTDVIDTSAIAGITAVQGFITGATQVAANSIAWIQSGANTIVYVNNSTAAEGQGSADMEIILTGITPSTLTSLDFFHI